MMNSSKKRSKRSKRSKVALVGGIALAAGLIYGCRTEKPPEFPITPQCQQQAAVQQSFVDLARLAMQAYGRIDPLLYEVQQEGKLALDPNAKEIDAAARQEFVSALAAIEKDKQRSLAFRANLDRAMKVCQADCKRQPYTIDVQPVEVKTENIQAYTYTLKTDAAPTKTELEAFRLLYSFTPPGSEECRAPASIDVQSPTTGVLLAFPLGLCKFPWPPPSRGGACFPPSGGHWTEWKVFSITLLCCEVE
jgi:hypothetical protein